MATHRNDMRKECNKNSRLYKIMHELGMCNFKIVLIEHYPWNNKDELLRRERYYFEIYDKNILLNSNRPIISNVEKKQDNNKYCKIWHIKNKNYHIQQMKTYQQNNKLQLKIYNQKYYQFNKLMQELPFYKVKCITSF